MILWSNGSAVYQSRGEDGPIRNTKYYHPGGRSGLVCGLSGGRFGASVPSMHCISSRFQILFCSNYCRDHSCCFWYFVIFNAATMPADSFILGSTIFGGRNLCWQNRWIGQLEVERGIVPFVVKFFKKRRTGLVALHSRSFWQRCFVFAFNWWGSQFWRN